MLTHVSSPTPSPEGVDSQFVITKLLENIRDKEGLLLVSKLTRGIFERLSVQRDSGWGCVDSAFAALHARQPTGASSVIGWGALPRFQVEFAEYRTAVGDDPRLLDWRVLARTDCITFGNLRPIPTGVVMWQIDCSKSMAFMRKVRVFDYARKIAATLSYMLVHQGDAVDWRFSMAWPWIFRPDATRCTCVTSLIHWPRRAA